MPNEIEEFLAQGTVALAGVSRSGGGYGNQVLRDLTRKGYRVLPVHPEVAELGGVPAYGSLAELPEPVGGLILVVPPDESEKLVREAAAAGIRRVWMQPGAESQAAIELGRRLGITVIHHECVMVRSVPRVGTGP